MRRREGRYLLRSNLTDRAPAELWTCYMQLVQVEEAFNPNSEMDLPRKGAKSAKPSFW